MLDRSQQDSWNLSVLVFDAIQIGNEDFVQLQIPPVERYRRLMQLCGASSAAAGGAVLSPVMRVQWAGEYGALRNFCMGTGSDKNLDHLTDNFFQYTRQHPCKIISLE